MKKRLQGFIAGILVCILFLSIPVFASGVTKTIKAVFNSVTVKIDNKEVSGDRISYNKNVYVSAKSVADYLGKDYSVDKNGNVSLNAKVVQKNTTTVLPQSLDINNVTIKLNKVEQDSDSLRLYVTYINNSDDEAQTGDNLASIVIGGKEYNFNSDFNFDRYYEKDNIAHCPDFIDSGVSTDSVIFFKPISNVDRINIVLCANDDDYRFKNIKVEKH
ncbi:MAG: hypothetical protein ACYDG2_13245 [Ruminiclostridium sp.]